MSSLPYSEIKAITKLLKTPDESTSRLLEEQFKTFDVKLLNEINNHIPLDDKELKKQFLQLVLKIKSDRLRKDFSKWSSSASDLEEGIFLVALFNNPLLDTEHYSNLLGSWADSLKKNLKKIKLDEDPTSVINEINHFLFMELGFKGNKENYYDPHNSFIDRVIERKLGNPILLSIVYLLIAKRLGLPFNGVNMPAHFIVQYTDSFEPIFVDPFNQGEIITRVICEERIRTLKLPWQNEFLSSPTSKQIISRVMQNLVNIYHSEGHFDLKETLEGYVNILKRS